jgi:glycosyltransferase involved in cell wall biosynthesis
MRKKVVLHIHGALFKEFYQTSHRCFRRLIALFLQKCDAVIVLSGAWKSFFRNIVDARNLFVVENGVDLSPFRKGVAATSVPSVLHLGEVSARKGIYDILEVADILKKQGLDFRFDIVGPGELERTAQIIAHKELSNYIILHGQQFGNRRFAHFQKAHSFILASYAEGFPIALIEALASGLPVISTTVGGIPDMIEHGQHGFLSAPGDVEAMAENVRLVLQDHDLHRTISKRNRAYAFARFDIERCADKLTKLYLDIL